MRKTKYYISMTAEERRLASEAMFRFHNKVISQDIDTVDIDQLIQKLRRKRRWF